MRYLGPLGITSLLITPLVTGLEVWLVRLRVSRSGPVKLALFCLG